MTTEDKYCYTLCANCGPNTKVDEDGCCNTCGADSMGQGVDQVNEDFAKLQLKLEAERKANLELGKLAKGWKEFGELSTENAELKDIRDVLKEELLKAQSETARVKGNAEQLDKARTLEITLLRGLLQEWLDADIDPETGHCEKDWGTYEFQVQDALVRLGK